MAPPAALTTRALNRATLARQGLLEPFSADPAASVERLGSLQAQHPEWPPVALAARASDARSAGLADALARRAVVRSSLMRNTIHIVRTTDLWPMFTVCRPLRINQWRLMMKADPVDSSLGRRVSAAHESAIAALREKPRSSLELDRLMTAEIGPDAIATTRVTRAAWRHFAAFVPLVHIPHDGEGYGRSKYALAENWLDEELPEVDEARARIHLARRYFAAFGPASVDDLVAYVGRGKGGIGVWREAVAALGDELVELRDDASRTLHDLATAPRPAGDIAAPPRLLARWDSLLLSHAPRHRGRVIHDRDRAAVFSKNADVLPTFLVDGFVAGTWELSRRDGTIAATLRPFRPLAPADAEALTAEADRVLGLLAPGADRAVRIER